MKKLRLWLRKIVKTKTFHICIILLIIAALIYVAYYKISLYDVEGEKEMPFEVSKIDLISSVAGESSVNQVQNEQNQPVNVWDVNISQNNDFYIYIEKNENYKSRKQQAIESVTIENFSIERVSSKGQEKIYKPDSESEKELFRNIETNETRKIEYLGSPKSDVKKMQMSNQGDLIYFRYTNKDIEKYTPTEEELDYSQLLQKIQVNEEDLQAKIKFDMTIKLISGTSFNTTVETKVPASGVVKQGTATEQIINKNQLIFKRN